MTIDAPPPPPPPPPPRDQPVADQVDRPIIEDAATPTGPQETVGAAEAAANTDEGAAPLSAVPETRPGQGADTADAAAPDASSPDTAPASDPVNRPIIEDAATPTGPQETVGAAEAAANTDEGAAPLSAVPETRPGQGADTADAAAPDASSPDTARDTDQSTARQDTSHAEPDGPITPMDKWEASEDRKLAEDIIAHRKQQDILRQQGNEQGAQEIEDFINKLPTTDAIKTNPQGYLDGKQSETESSQSSAEVPRMDPGSSDGVPPSPADGLTEPGRTEIEDDPRSNEALPLRLEGPTEVLGLGSPYTMRALFEEHTLSDFADHQTRSPDGLSTTGQDVAPPNAEFFAWPADSADADAWNQLPEQVRDSFRGEVRMEEFHDGIGRIVDLDSSIDGGYWYRDGDAAENEETWRRDDAVLGQWNSGSSYIHLDGSEAPIKGWVGTTRGQSTLDGGWLPGGKEGIYIPRSEMFKLRDASVSGGKVPWRS